MLRRTPALVFIAVALLCVAGCKTSDDLKPKGKITVALDLETKKTRATVNVLDLVTLELPPVELPGYAWMIFLNDTRFLKQMTDILPPAMASDRPTVRFLAVRATPNTTTVRFLLVKQDGSKEADPIDGHDAIFTIQ